MHKIVEKTNKKLARINSTENAIYDLDRNKDACWRRAIISSVGSYK